MSKKGGSAFDDIIGDDEDDAESEQSVTESQSEDTSIENSVDDTSTTTGGSDDATSSVVSSAARTVESGPSLEDSSPPFDFNDAEQDSLYPRKGTWDELSDFRYQIDGDLRELYNVRNVEKREVDEALLRLLLERIPSEVVARRVVEQRGFSPD